MRYLYLAKRRQLKSMKVTTWSKTIALITALAGIGLAPATRAAHATEFLDALETAVDNRLAAVDENTPPEERRALTAAANVLDRNSKTLAADLNLLAQAATSLDAAFSADAEFSTAEEGALLSFSTEAQAQFDAVLAQLGTNDPPVSIANKLAQAQEALDRGNDGSNNVPTRARAIAFALNKIRVAALQAARTFKAPVSLDQQINLNARGNGQDVTLEASHTYTIPGDEGDENGTWEYERTSAKTATITLYPLGGDPRTIELKFNNSSRGTFNGTTAGGDTFKGQFTVVSE